MDIDQTICKTNISSLEMQVIQQASKLEWMRQELRLAREEREALEMTVEELNNQVKELATKLESGALALKSFSDVCTFRAADFHTLINNIQQQQRDYSTSSSIEPAAPPPSVADTQRTNLVQPSAVHE